MIYLDHAATTMLKPHVKQHIIEILDIFQNPSSKYQNGVNVRKIIDDSRSKIAKFINASAENIFFTPSGSASNTLAVKGFYEKHDCRMLYSPIAHKSILNCVEKHRYSYPLKVDKNGFIDTQDLKEWLTINGSKSFVVFDYANSEIGTIQNVKEIIDLVHFYNGIVMLDCTGSIPTIPLDVNALDVDLASFSAHKLGALKGCGVLYKKTNIDIAPLIYGTQEHGLVGGTENVVGILSLAKAIEEFDYSSSKSDVRDFVYNYILEKIPCAYLVGAPIGENRLSNNLYICFRGVKGESLMTLLDMNGVQVSTGSACNSYIPTPSPTLVAIEMDKSDIFSCIRMTFSGDETIEQLDYVCKKLSECVNQLRSFT